MDNPLPESESRDNFTTFELDKDGNPKTILVGTITTGISATPPDEPLIATVQLEITGDFWERDSVWLQFLKRVNANPFVIVLSSLRYDFPGEGLSGLVMLAESHAAIHTWPEQHKAWVELATCGDPAGIPAFIEQMRIPWKYDEALNDG